MRGKKKEKKRTNKKMCIYKVVLSRFAVIANDNGDDGEHLLLTLFSSPEPHTHTNWTRLNLI